MGMQKEYSRINWQNKPNMSTPLGKTLLNHMDVEINKLDDRTVVLDATKLNISAANLMLASISINPKTGAIKATHLDGTEQDWDLNLEKIPVKMTLTEDAVLVMETEDGETFQADLKGLIDTYIFDDGETIGFSQTSQEDGKHVTAGVKKGSLTEEYLNPDVMAEIRQSKLDAQTSASDALGHSQMSKRWSIGDEGVPGSDTDNAKYYKEQTAADALLAESFTHGGTGTREGEDTDNAEYYKKQAEAVSAVEIATTESAGIVRPDGDTITVDADGTIHGANVADVTEAGITATEDTAVFPVPAAKETAGGFLGKTRKWMQDFADFKTGIITLGKIVNNGLCTEPGFVADARQLNPNIPDTLAARLSTLNSDLMVYDLTTYSGALVTFSPGSYFAYSEKNCILYISCSAGTHAITSPIMTPIITLPIDIPNTAPILAMTDIAMENGNATRTEIKNHTVSLSCNTGMHQPVHCYASFLMS